MPCVSFLFPFCFVDLFQMYLCTFANSNLFFFFSYVCVYQLLCFSFYSCLYVSIKTYSFFACPSTSIKNLRLFYLFLYLCVKSICTCISCISVCVRLSITNIFFFSSAVYIYQRTSRSLLLPLNLTNSSARYVNAERACLLCISNAVGHSWITCWLHIADFSTSDWILFYRWRVDFIFWFIFHVFYHNFNL